MTRGRARVLTRYLREYDNELYAIARYGRIDILRKCIKYDSYDIGTWMLLAPRPNDHLVMSLTTNWSIDGIPVDWGIEPMLRELGRRDLWKRDYAGDMIKSKERADESMDRTLSNQTEDFWKENRRSWAKNFDTINRSNLSRPDRRYRDDLNRKLKGI